MSQNMSQEPAQEQDIFFHGTTFTTMTNHCLQDTTLPLEARGLLATMYSLRSDWNYSISGLNKILPDCKDKISRVIKILEKHGYLRRESYRDAGGHFKYKYHIYDISQIYGDEHCGIRPNKSTKTASMPIQDTGKNPINTESKPRPEMTASVIPDTVNPDTEIPYPGMASQLRNNKSNTNIKLLKSINQKSQAKKPKETIDVIERKTKIKADFEKRLDYERLIGEYPDKNKLVKLIFSVIADTLAHEEKDVVKISGYSYSYSEISDALYSLVYEHIVYVIRCISSRGKAMTNPVNYILQCLLKADTKDIYEASQMMPDRSNKFNSFLQNDYDYDELEKMLLDN